MEALTRFAHGGDWPALSSVPGKNDAPRVGKVTHPSGAPDNHLLCTYSPGNAHFHSAHTVKWPGETLLDAGIYLIKAGKPIDEPAADAAHQERPEVQRAVAAGPGALQAHLRRRRAAAPCRRWPTTASCRRTCRKGRRSAWSARRACTSARAFPTASSVRASVTATWPATRTEVPYRHLGGARNWVNQGADAGLYTNDDIHAIRILAMEPTTDRRNGAKAGRLFYNHARERLRILGEIPVRKFDATASSRLDPDGNPDTSFLAKIPADVRLHVPDARQERHGAEHGPDLAPGPARRDPQRLRRLPRPQPEADAASRTPPRPSRTTPSST